MKDGRKTRKELEKELIELKANRAQETLMDMIKGWQRDRIRVERKQLDKIINCLPNGVSVINADLKVLYQNRWLDERFGRNVWQLCYRKYLKTNQPCTNCLVKNAIKHNRIEKGELETKDGRTYEIIAAPIGEFDGKPSGVEILIDITDKKLTEKDLCQAQQKYVDLVNNLNVGIFRSSTDLEGHFLDVNPALVSMLHADSKKELLKHKVIDFYERYNKRQVIINKVLKQGALKDETARFVTLKNKHFWASISLVKNEDAEGNVVCEGIVEDISKYKQHEKKLQSLTLTDELTKLHNRRGFTTLAEHQLKVAKRHQIETTLFFIDLDDLKWINDTFGHLEGDKALVDIGNFLRNTCRESDVIGRIGGDEFAVFTVGLDKENSNTYVNRLQKKIDDYNLQTPRSYKLSVSVGAAYHELKKPFSIDELLSQADTLMYQQKQNKLSLGNRGGDNGSNSR